MRIRRKGEPAGQAGTGPGGSFAGPACVRHRLRADAARNREAIVMAAREMFAAQGLNASLEEIAARAGVGIGTLYRRFPARRELIAAALDEQVAEYAAAARCGLADPDPWTGLAGFVQRACELQAGDRGLAELLAGARQGDDEVARPLRAVSGDIAALIDRAKADGKLRADFTTGDLALVLTAAGAVAHVTQAGAPGAWRRFLALTMEGFQAPDFAVKRFTSGPACTDHASHPER